MQAPRRIAAKRQITLAHLVILEGEDGIRLLKRYAGLMQKRLQGAMQVKPRITGWNSWDYYAAAVTQADVAEQASFARRRYGDTLQVMGIDDGYECQWGKAWWIMEDSRRTSAFMVVQNSRRSSAFMVLQDSCRLIRVNCKSTIGGGLWQTAHND